MIRFGLRLTLGGGREAAARLVIIATAVALGVGMLLTTLAGLNAVNATNARYAWLLTGDTAMSATGKASTPASGRTSTPDEAGSSTSGQGGVAPADPLWWLLRPDYVNGQQIGRVDVAGTGPHSSVPPGIPRLPANGEFYASPALTALLASTPADELGNHFPGHQVGTIGRSALPAPNSLIVVVGRSATELSHLPGATRVGTISTTSPSECRSCTIGYNTDAIDLILSVVAMALIFPVLILIGGATRLAAARREQRFAAMRLVGATPRQISVISTVESTVAAAAGTVVGFGLFLSFRSPLAAIPFTGNPFFPADLSLGPRDVVLVALGVPTAAAVAARLALRRVHISPLGVSQRVTPRAPRAWRLIPLVAGLAELAMFVAMGRPGSTTGQVWGYLSGFLITMIGLVVAGPWLTMVGSRTMARRTNKPATLIAARRLADNPKASFRAISGLVLALFVTSAAVGVMTTFLAERVRHTADSTSATTLIDNFMYYGATASGQPTTSEAVMPPGVLSTLRSIQGVRGVTVLHTNPDGIGRRTVKDGTRVLRIVPGLVSCDQLAGTRLNARCPPGASTTTALDREIYSKYPLEKTGVQPPAAVSPGELARLPADLVVVRTDGTSTAINRARTVLEIAFPQFEFPATDDEFQSEGEKTLAGWTQLANVVIITSLPIAGCSLAVGVAAGLSDRRRPFSLMRLAGAPLGLLRRVLLMESAGPLLLGAVGAIGTGFLAAHLFVTSQLGYSLHAPGAVYYLLVLAGLAGSLGILVSTFPLLRRATGPDTARNG